MVKKILNFVKNKTLKYLTLAAFIYSQSAFAGVITEITSPINDNPYPTTVTTTNFSITGDGYLTTNYSIGLDVSGVTDSVITINTNDSSQGISSLGYGDGNLYPAINFQTNSSLSNLTISSGTVSSESAYSTEGNYGSGGTIYVPNITNSTISLGQESGESTATISNSSLNGAAIFSKFDSATNLTLNVNATGSVIAKDDSTSTAIVLINTDNSGAFTLNNSGTINTENTDAGAIYLEGYSATINNSGTINGDITLGTSAESQINSNAGAINGDILMGNAAQLVYLNGGTINGAINGSGQVIASASSSTLGGTIGDSSTVSLVKVYAGNTLDFSNYNVTADAITLESGAILSVGYATVSGAIDGSNSGDGTLNLTGESIISSAVGATNSLAAITVADSASATLQSNVTATNITVGNGSGGILTIAASAAMNGTVTIDNNATLKLESGSAVYGTIDGTSAGNGSLYIAGAVEAQSDIGNTNALGTVNITSGASLDLSTNNNILKATYILLQSEASLSIGNGVVAGSIMGGSADVGSVTFAGVDYSLNGDVGGEGNYLASLSVLNSLDAGSYSINSSQISLSSSATLNTSGSLAGAVQMSDASTLTLQDGAQFNGNINSATDSVYGTINTYGAVQISGQVGATYAVSELNVANGSTLTINNNDSSGVQTISANNVNVAGTLDLVDAATINGNVAMTSSNATINTENHSHSISGNFSTVSGSTLSVIISSSTTDTVLNVAGTALLAESTKLNLTVADAITNGTVITLVSGSAGSSINAIDGANINVGSSGSNNYNGQTFTTSVSGNELLLTVSQQAAPTSFNNSAKGVFDAVIGLSSATGNLSTLQSYLQNNAISDSDKQAVAKSVTPQVDNSTNRITFNNISTSASLISGRIASVRSGIASGDDSSKNSSWGQIFGSTANQGNTASSGGYSSSSYVIAFGYDNEISDDFLLGVGVSYANSSISGRNNQNTKIDSYQLNLYSGYTAEQFFLNTMIGFGVNEYNSHRYISLVGNTATAKYSGQSYSSRIELGQNYQIAENGTIFTPTFAITAAKNMVNSYDEQGAGNLNLHVNNSSANFFEGRLGVDFSRIFKTNSDEQYTPHFGFSYGYDFAGNSQRTTSNFIGQSSNFTSSGARIAQGSWRIDTGVTFYNIKDFNISANYTFDHRSRFNASTGWLRFKYGF